jgi:hypothetical protein
MARKFEVIRNALQRRLVSEDVTHAITFPIQLEMLYPTSILQAARRERREFRATQSMKQKGHPLSVAHCCPTVRCCSQTR